MPHLKVSHSRTGGTRGLIQEGDTGVLRLFTRLQAITKAIKMQSLLIMPLDEAKVRTHCNPSVLLSKEVFACDFCVDTDVHIQ